MHNGAKALIHSRCGQDPSMKPPPDPRKEVIECQNWMMEQFRGKDGKNKGLL
jgi:hypothetical protein